MAELVVKLGAGRVNPSKEGNIYLRDTILPRILELVAPKK